MSISDDDIDDNRDIESGEYVDCYSDKKSDDDMTDVDEEEEDDSSSESSDSSLYTKCDKDKHRWNDENGKCNICYEKCKHNFWHFDSTCNICNYVCTHLIEDAFGNDIVKFRDGICTLCKHECDHQTSIINNDYECEVCGIEVMHEWDDFWGECKKCKIQCDHIFCIDKCMMCGIQCRHSENHILGLEMSCQLCENIKNNPIQS